MTESRIPIPSKVPQIPNRNPNRPSPSSLPMRKRQADPPSLRHDPRTKDISSSDNDRKRRGIVMPEKDEEVEGGQCFDGLDDGLFDNSKLEQSRHERSDSRYNTSQHTDSAIDLSLENPGLDVSSDIPQEQRPLLPKPLSLKPKLFIDTNLPRSRGKFTSKIPSLIVSKRPLPFLPYSDSEYSDDDNGSGLGQSKKRRENDDPRKYRHNVDSYLRSSSESTIKPIKASPEPVLIKSEDDSTKGPYVIDEHKGTPDKFEPNVIQYQSPKPALRELSCNTTDLWFEVDFRPMTCTRTTTHQLECKSRVSRSRKPYGQWLVDIKVEFIHEEKTIAFIKGRFLQRSLIKSNFQEALRSLDKTVSGIPLDIFDRYGRLKRELKDHEVRKGTGI
ncbi:hypothetical protein ONS96_008406 [Cadophora gregata f. sp. sojae]|nr:hypothetical protein ONS96_008406 [Cadophora gregata f. sp. sojae]